MKTNANHPLLQDTKAFVCAKCGAVALTADGVCAVQGQGTRADWCGSKSLAKPECCKNKIHNHRFACGKCGKIALNPEILCDPQPLK